MKKTQTYAAVLAEIQQLQQRAAELRKSELPGVIKRIREAVTTYELTAADLGLGTGGSAAAPAAPAAAPRGRATSAKGGLQTGVAKYRDPKTGKTWTGRGKPPLWIVGAKDRTPFLIDASQAPAEAQRGGRPTQAAKRGARAATGRKRAARKPAAAPADTRPEGGDTASD
jgi:DNA-binding protein H-NS